MLVPTCAETGARASAKKVIARLARNTWTNRSKFDIFLSSPELLVLEERLAARSATTAVTGAEGLAFAELYHVYRD
jgi:hypothetical protein